MKRHDLRVDDHVLTPSGRLAVVDRLLHEDGRARVLYASGVRGEVTLAMHLLRLVSAADAERMNYRA